MSLQALLNKSRADVSVAFHSVQNMRSYAIEDYMAQLVSDYKVSYGDLADWGL